MLRRGTAARLVAPVQALIETDDIFARDAAWWNHACEGADAVIHAAWYVKHGRYLDAPENALCVQGSFALAQGAALARVRQVIGLGTCMEYRLPGESLSVGDPTAPANFYAACKLATFGMMREWLALQGIDFSWCRLFYLHGAGEHPERIGAYLHGRLQAGERASLSSGEQVRDFLDVREAGAMIANLVDSGQTGIVNICSGRPVSLRAFAEAIADGYGRRDLLDFGGQPPRPSDPPAVAGVCNLAMTPELLEYL